MDAGLARVAMMLTGAETSARRALTALRQRRDSGKAAHDLVVTAIESLVEARKRLKKSGDRKE